MWFKYRRALATLATNREPVEATTAATMFMSALRYLNWQNVTLYFSLCFTIREQWRTITHSVVASPWPTCKNDLPIIADNSILINSIHISFSLYFSIRALNSFFLIFTLNYFFLLNNKCIHNYLFNDTYHYEIFYPKFG